MKKSKIFFLFLFLIPFFSIRLCLAQTTVEAEVFAEIIPALTASETAQLNFGKFTPTTQGGQVLISPEGSRMATGTVVLAEGPHQSARFYVTGEDNATFSISLPTEETRIINTNTSKFMLVSNWVSTPENGIGTGVLEGGGQEISVGATLTVGTVEENPVGLYSGTYYIRFDYN